MFNSPITQSRILFFSAHPDDEVGGAGGFLIKSKRAGAEVRLVLCINPYEKRPGSSEEVESQTRLDEFKMAADKIGAEWSFLNLDRFPQVNRDNFLPLVREIRDFKPDIVMTLQEDDYHTEHRMVAQLVKRAVWHASRNAFPDLGEPHQVRQLWFAEGDRPMPDPNHLEDITEVVKDKEKVFAVYTSQLKRKKLIEAFIGLNRFRGLMYKRGEYAEAFKITDFWYG